MAEVGPTAPPAPRFSTSPPSRPPSPCCGRRTCRCSARCRWCRWPATRPRCPAALPWRATGRSCRGQTRHCQRQGSHLHIWRVCQKMVWQYIKTWKKKISSKYHLLNVGSINIFLQNLMSEGGSESVLGIKRYNSYSSRLPRETIQNAILHWQGKCQHRVFKFERETQKKL